MIIGKILTTIKERYTPQAYAKKIKTYAIGKLKNIMVQPVHKVHLTYFKPSGKYYTEADWTLPRPCTYYEGVEHTKNMIICGAAPGLSSGSWEGSVLIQFSESDVPHLLPANQLFPEFSK